MKGMKVSVFEVTKTYLMKGWIQNEKINEKIKYRELKPTSRGASDPVKSISLM